MDKVKTRVRHFIAIFLVSMAMLNIQVAATRLLSYKFYFHYVFLVISLAQLGLAGAGAWVFTLRKQSQANTVTRIGLLGAAAASVLFLLGFAWLSPHPNVGLAKVDGYTAVPYLIALCLLFVCVYFSVGFFYSTVFTQHRSWFNRLYAADLLGAALGCLASVGLMWFLGPIRAFLISSMLTLVALMLTMPGDLSGPRALKWYGGAALCGLAVVVALLYPQTFDPNVRYGFSAILENEWNHLARTDRMGPGHYVIDGDASTAIFDPQFNIEYRVAPPNPRVAIIGVGAGPQLTVALQNNAQSVLAIDINPTIINWVLGKDSEAIGRIFEQPNVTTVVDEGRHAVRSSNEPFDMIVMHAVDTYAATSTGAYSLSENYLYTVEAFQDFLSKLSPQGIIAIRRWLFYPPRENLRLFTTICRSLRESGAANPENHIVVLSPVSDFRRPDLKEWGYILVNQQPFSESQLTAIDAYVNEHQWSYLHRPGARMDTVFSEFAYSTDREAFYQDYPYYVWPTTDANPFFFQFVPPFASLYQEAVESNSVLYTQSSDLLFVTLILLVILLAILLALPLYLRRRSLRTTPPSLASTVYFSSLGVGFMAIELACIQIMSLFLGHPTYSISVVLFGMLAFAGLGSMLARRFQFGTICLVVCALAGIAGIGLLPLIHTLISLPFAVRVVITLVCLFLLAVPMGMPMATGIHMIGEENKAQVAWAWACNGGAAVIGTNVCMILMVYFGTPIVLFVGAACYLLAHFMLARISRTRIGRATC